MVNKKKKKDMGRAEVIALANIWHGEGKEKAKLYEKDDVFELSLEDGKKLVETGSAKWVNEARQADAVKENKRAEDEKALKIPSDKHIDAKKE